MAYKNPLHSGQITISASWYHELDISGQTYPWSTRSVMICRSYCRVGAGRSVWFRSDVPPIYKICYDLQIVLSGGRRKICMIQIIRTPHLHDLLRSVDRIARWEADDLYDSDQTYPSSVWSVMICRSYCQVGGGRSVWFRSDVPLICMICRSYCQVGAVGPVWSTSCCRVGAFAQRNTTADIGSINRWYLY